MTFRALLSRHAGAAFWRQQGLAELVGSASWGIDMGEGRLTIGGHAFPIQLLGSEAEGDGTWLWAWANVQSGLPPELVRFSEGLRERGECDGIAELSERSFPIERANGHEIGLVASGLARDGHAYYRAPYDGGALYVLLGDVPVPGAMDVPAVRVPGVLGQVVSTFDLDHRALTTGFLADAGFAPEDRGEVVSGRRGDDVVTVTFDARGRIGGMEGTIAPDEGGAGAAATDGAGRDRETRPGLGARLRRLFGG